MLITVYPASCAQRDDSGMCDWIFDDVMLGGGGGGTSWFGSTPPAPGDGTHIR